jgi:carbon starvation protein CstA
MCRQHVMFRLFHEYGNALEQIVVLVVLVTAALTVKLRVAMESQPVALTSVSLYVPAAVMLMPFQRYGNALAHIVVLVVLVTLGTDS